MCGIAGAIHLSGQSIPCLPRRLETMNYLQKHRGPDGEGIWEHPSKSVGLGHCRLSIIDIDTGKQPMRDQGNNWLTFNGEIYNYLELREGLGSEKFRTKSDTEVILLSYRKWEFDCVKHFRGMFAFSLWDEKNQLLFCARDRFGIKPFYYTIVDGILYYASEVKALLPFLQNVEIDLEGFKDYLTFQFCLAGKTLFKGINELLPGHYLTVVNGQVTIQKYWEVYYHADLDHTANYFDQRINELLVESIDLHLRSDIPIGSYLSGGLDSSIIASLASERYQQEFIGFTGKFSIGKEYDESEYARALADWRGFDCKELDITAQDFVENIHKVIYHLDYPVAGPGSFPQYMVSEMASKYRKVVLGGQGADEIFGGYTRYLVAYFEQCIKGAIDGTMDSTKFIVTYESIIPNLTTLRNYKPMLQQFWKDGIFDSLDRRYFRLINRTPSLEEEINWEALNNYHPFETFQTIFLAENVGQESYFDSMTHFDFKTLLPALLHIEDRVSMAHGLESRVPFLDHPLVELAATIPASIKFTNGTMKRVLKDSMSYCLPKVITERKDKMGFPVPLVQWMQQDIKDFIFDIFSSQKAMNRDLINNKKVLGDLENEWKFGRKTWGLLCLEIWQTQFLDKVNTFK